MKWRPIPGWSQYEVSDEGQVKSLGNEFNRKEKILRPGLKVGYRMVVLCDKKPKRRRNIRIAELVAEAFMAPRPANGLMYLRHLNDIRTDDRLANLVWGTPTDNLNDAYRNGKRPNYRGKPRST